MHTAWAERPENSPFEVQQQELSRAFSSFSQAASSLERSYAQLHTEVGRLRRELQQKNCDLERSLQENLYMREYLGHIVEALPCGIVVTDEHGAVCMANPEARRLAALADSIRAEDGSVAPEAEAELLQKEECGREREFVFASPAGECSIAVRRAALSHGNEQHRIFILRDISEQKRLEKERQQMRRREALAEMSAVLAHEIRNPLGSLELFAELLAENGGCATHEERADWIAQVQAGLRTLSATVNNVLHFHSLPAPSLVHCDLGEVVDRACEFLAPLARQSDIEMRVENALHGVTRAADPHRLQQVLLNLVLNALRFTPGRGRITLGGIKTGEKDSSAAEITVADTGAGIAPEHLEKIFSPGFSTRPGSPGLGLAVCKKIVEQHGGTIFASHSPQPGAVFTVRLPLS